MKRFAFLIVLLCAACAGYAPSKGAAAPRLAEGEEGTSEYLVIERGALGGLGAEAPRGGEMRAQIEGEMVRLPLERTTVEAEIALHVAGVRVRQQFGNPYATKIEAIYVFPLPHDAAVTDFVMTIGERRIRGIIREREEARRIYQEAKMLGLVAALLTQGRPNIFEQSVANIEPGKRIDVEIDYFHTVQERDGAYEFVFPMVVGPRYTPAGRTAPPQPRYLAPGQRGGSTVGVKVTLDAGMALRDLSCATHPVAIERTGESGAKILLSEESHAANRDFILRWKTDPRMQGALATRRDESGGYFTLLLQPPADLESIPAMAREMIFVVDCSGSMNGEPLAACKRAMRRCLDRLDDRDTFQIIRFSRGAAAMGPRLLTANLANRQKGRQYIDELSADGGTEMVHGVRAALRFPGDPERRRVVSFMTDGYIGNEAEILREIRENLGHARIFSFGVGSSVNRYLLEEMASEGRGVAAYVGLDDHATEAVDALYRRIERPALSDLQIDWGGLAVSDLEPARLPDLYLGRPVVLTGRYSGTRTAKVTVRGRAGSQAMEIPIAFDPTDAATGHAAIPRLWARARIASIYKTMVTADASPELSLAILDLALQHNLVSAFTSFVAVDTSRVTEGDHGTTVEVPVPTPEGVRYETAVPAPAR